MLVLSRLADRKRPHASFFLCSALLACFVLATCIFSHAYIVTSVSTALFTIQQNVGLFAVDQYAVSGGTGKRSHRMRILRVDLNEWEVGVCPDPELSGNFSDGGAFLKGVSFDADVGAFVKGVSLAAAAAESKGSNDSETSNEPFSFETLFDPDKLFKGDKPTFLKSSMLCDCVSLLRKTGLATCFLNIAAIAVLFLAVSDVWDAVKIDEVFYSVYGGTIDPARDNNNGQGNEAEEFNYFRLQGAEATELPNPSGGMPTVVALRSLQTLDGRLCRQLHHRSTRDLSRCKRRLRIALVLCLVPIIIIWLYVFFRLSAVRRDLARLLEEFAGIPKALEVPLDMALGASFWFTAAIAAAVTALLMHHETIGGDLAALDSFQTLHMPSTAHQPATILLTSS